MKNTPLNFLMLLGAFALGGATTIVAQDTTYVWQSADGDPYNIQGTLVLDSPSSANGSASDVMFLSISDTVDTYSWTPATGGGPGALYTGAPFVTFEWNTSQILEMDLSTPGPKPEWASAIFEAHPNGTGAIADFSVLQPPAQAPGDQSGEWVAATTVPEPSIFYLLFVGGSTALFAQWRKRQSL